MIYSEIVTILFVFLCCCNLSSTSTLYCQKSINTDYMRQAQVLNIENLSQIIYLWNFNENIK